MAFKNLNLTITLTNNDEDQTQRHVFLRAIDVVTDLIIGLPSVDLSSIFSKSHVSPYSL